MQGPAAVELRRLLQQARTPLLRSMRAFAEQEIVIPGGPYAGRRFRCHFQPYTALWFDAVDSHRWSRHVATGPTQSGKTLACFVIVLLYHLFEIGETVICGLPDMDMAGDKWREDILPAIECSRYRELLPKQGGGSRGGRVESIQFTNGATLKFMSGGGGDKSRAGFTSRVVVVTETDGMDEASVRSRESDKITCQGRSDRRESLSRWPSWLRGRRQSAPMAGRGSIWISGGRCRRGRWGGEVSETNVSLHLMIHQRSEAPTRNWQADS